MSLKIRQKSDSCSIDLIFGGVAHYACLNPQNESVYSISRAVHLFSWIMINISFFWGEVPVGPYEALT